MRGNLDGAIRKFDSAIEANPREPLFLAARGAAFSEKRDYDRAITDFDRALSLKPDYVVALTDRGGAYVGKRDLTHAIDDFDQALRLEPTFFPALVNRGQAHFSRGDFKKGIEDFNQALSVKTDPSVVPSESGPYRNITWRAHSAGAYSNYCYMRAVTGRSLDEALSDCDESLRQRPKSPGTLEVRALVQLRLSHFDNAIADANASLELKPRMVHPIFVRGLARRRLGDVIGGDQDLASARAIDPNIDAYYSAIGVEP